VTDVTASSIALEWQQPLLELELILSSNSN